MKRSFILLLIVSLTISACFREGGKYVSEWKYSPDGSWIGPGLWANRLQDWTVEDGKLLCINTKPMRTVHLTNRMISNDSGNITSTVYIYLTEGSDSGNEAAAGFLIGAGYGLDYRAASLIHHSYGKLGGLFIGLDGQSNLFVRDFEKEDSYLIYNNRNRSGWPEAYLILHASPDDGNYRIKVAAVNPATNQVIDRIDVEDVPGDRLRGNIALVSHSGYSRESNSTYSFSNWQVAGSKIKFDSSHNIGPIVGIQYTLSRNILKMTAQMMPVGQEESRHVELELFEDEEWKPVTTAEIVDYSFTAHFRMDKWDRKDDIPFRLKYIIDRKSKHEFLEYGIIKHDPVEKDSIVLLSLSCIDQTVRPEQDGGAGIDRGQFPWDWALLYPHNQLVDNLKRFSADLLFFAGDQVYEGSSPTAADIGPSVHLDYLYKWYLFCQTYKDLISTVPSISIPDDHDVYHGNLWGAGGRPTPPGATGAAAQDAGGYKQSPEFVNMVQTTQTSHLPDPFDPAPVEQDIGVYYTECNVGGVSFAVLEDRKFKSAPGDMLTEADIVNGWPRNLEWDGRINSRIEATLLGERQLSFLELWAADWSNQTWMKAALSQTLFANLATIPAEAANDNIVQSMEVPDSGIYLRTDRFVTDFDSDGWPQVGRDRAIRIFRKAFATHIAGDQHLGSTVQYGIENWRDAGYAIISPAVGNIWSRRWHPPVEGRNRKENWPGFLGDFEDGFGNKITVHAVANPHRSIIEPTRHHEKSTGYSTITFIKSTRDIELANWPYYAGPGNGDPFPFWPVRFNQLDNFGKVATHWLPELRITGLDNPVVRIIREVTGETIYALRINGTSFQPKVFSFGSYRIEVGEPDEDRWQTIESIYATSFPERGPLEIGF
ncbi:MAG TPA: alkaline phosphatase D family protein [Bacteroidales bacterium]|nr:alkaline phosphatase D family protein [Bacteroidales bacterium]